MLTKRLAFLRVSKSLLHNESLVLSPYPLGTRRCCDVESTSMTLILRRNNVVCPVGTGCIPAGSDICHRGCAYIVLQTVQRFGVYSAVYSVYQTIKRRNNVVCPVCTGCIPAGSDICHRGCAYKVLQTVQRFGVYSAVYSVYGTVHYKERLKSFDKKRA